LLRLTIAKNPERYSQRRCVAQQHILVRSGSHFFKCVVLDINDFRHEQKRRAPARAVDAVVFPHELILARGTQATLDGNAKLALSGSWATSFDESLGVGFVKIRSEFFSPCLELFENRPHQMALGRKGVPATVESRLDPIFRDPQALLCEESALDRRRAEVADLQDNSLLLLARFVRLKILECRKVVIQPAVHSSGQHQARSHGTIGKATQG